jgi:hypothetical protein
VTLVISWHIQGNGPVPYYKELNQANQRQQNCLRVGFNLPPAESLEFDLVISNGHRQGKQKSLIVSGLIASETLKKALQSQAQMLEVHLGAWPSLGCVAIHTAVAMGIHPIIHRMNLLPDISRPPLLGAREPLASLFHNWLAERRTMLPLLGQMCWPEFVLDDDMPSQSKPILQSVMLEIQPLAFVFERLFELPQLERESGSTVIRQVVSLPYTFWKANVPLLEAPALAKLDQLFYLNRGENITPCWWLYDVQYSELMNRIRLHIASAEQHAFTRARI